MYIEVLDRETYVTAFEFFAIESLSPLLQLNPLGLPELFKGAVEVPEWSLIIVIFGPNFDQLLSV